MILQNPPSPTEPVVATEPSDEEKLEPEVEINFERQANDTTPENPFDGIIAELGPNVSQYCFST